MSRRLDQYAIARAAAALSRLLDRGGRRAISGDVTHDLEVHDQDRHHPGGDDRSRRLSLVPPLERGEVPVPQPEPTRPPRPPRPPSLPRPPATGTVRTFAAGEARVDVRSTSSALPPHDGRLDPPQQVADDSGRQHGTTLARPTPVPPLADPSRRAPDPGSDDPSATRDRTPSTLALHSPRRRRLERQRRSLLGRAADASGLGLRDELPRIGRLTSRPDAGSRERLQGEPLVDDLAPPTVADQQPLLPPVRLTNAPPGVEIVQTPGGILISIDPAIAPDQEDE